MVALILSLKLRYLDLRSEIFPDNCKYMLLDQLTHNQNCLVMNIYI